MDAFPEKDMSRVFGASSQVRRIHARTVNHLAGSHAETVIPPLGHVLGFLGLSLKLDSYTQERLREINKRDKNHTCHNTKCVIILYMAKVDNF